MSRHGRPGDGQYRIRGMDRDRLWSRLPDRTSDPLQSPTAAAAAAAQAST
jgi:hypothetical protein